LFRPIRRYDDRLRWLSLAFLFFIALLPFSPGSSASSLLATAIAIYSLNVLPLGFISFALTRHAYANNRLVNTSIARGRYPQASWLSGEEQWFSWPA